MKNFYGLNIKPNKAIDLGCGAGRDTICLIKNGWNVLSIDKEDVQNIIRSKLNEKELSKFTFLNQTFENVEFGKTDLLLANYSLPFSNMKVFDKVWDKIKKSILKDGYFVGNFLGRNDEWVKHKKNMIFLSRDEVLSLFKDSFDIIKFEEIEKDAKTGIGNMKHWHLFNVIARKVK